MNGTSRTLTIQYEHPSECCEGIDDRISYLNFFAKYLGLP